MDALSMLAQVAARIRLEDAAAAGGGGGGTGVKAMIIVALCIAMLAKGLMGAFAIIKIIKTRAYQQIIIVSSLGAAVLGDLLGMIGIAADVGACVIIGCVFWLIGWAGWGTGELLLFLAGRKGPIQLMTAEPISLTPQ
jgi:hypothetical protein